MDGWEDEGCISYEGIVIDDDNINSPSLLQICQAMNTILTFINFTDLASADFMSVVFNWTS